MDGGGFLCHLAILSIQRFECPWYFNNIDTLTKPNS